MVSPWMGNSNLNWYISQNPESDRYALCTQVADGVAHIHNNNIVHGDIKGPNILVAEDHTIKLMDFGSSTLKQEYTLKFETSSGPGAFSVRWAAPELLSVDEEEEAKLTFETDIYALGMTFLEIMSGRAPYHEFKKDTSIITRITKRILPKRPELGMPKGDIQADLLWSLMQDTWAHDPQYRPNASVVCDTIKMITAYNQSQQQHSSLMDWTSAARINAFEVIMSILPEVIWLATVTGRSDHTSTFMDLPWQPIAVAISQGQYLKAVEWIEQGRSTIWNQTFRPRALRSADSLLQHKLQQTRDMLYDVYSQALHSEATTADYQESETVDQKYQRLMEECGQLMDKILHTLNFSSFPHPRRALHLLHAAQAGPVVLFNFTNLRCDALILTPGEIMHVNFPSVLKARITKACKSLRGFQTQPYEDPVLCGRPNGVFSISSIRYQYTELELWEQASAKLFKKVLEFLWLEIARPVLDCLDYINNPPAGNLPRLTWCTTGQLAYLPLHAAGYYDRPKCKVSDFVVSSYTPSLGALLPVGASEPVSLPHSHMLAVASANAPGHTPTPYTRSELDVISRRIKHPCVASQVMGPGARCENVLTEMEASDWLHFAGPIQAEITNPAKSYFQLEDGRLNFDTITQKSFRDKGLAFLSSCCEIVGDKGGTQEGQELVNEAVHLGSAMLTAGYRSVIATTGVVMDNDCPILADKVYELLLNDGTMDYRDSARALHEAVKVLRERLGDDKFYRWVPFIHIGA
ncbi:hypothetical protein ACGC1H_002371 [Rhizoctonia solani]